MNESTPTPQDWQNALNGPINILLDVVSIVGVIGIVLGIYLLIKSSPKPPPRKQARR